MPNTTSKSALFAGLPLVPLLALAVGAFTGRVAAESLTITTFAGPVESPGAIDGTGSAARFDAPSGVAVDALGNVYVADTGNSTIRKITPGGAVSTLAGLAVGGGSADGKGSAAGFNRPPGVAVDGSGNVYVAGGNSPTVRKITPTGDVTTLAGLEGSWGSADGTGSAARFYQPDGMAVDGSGNVYVADGANYTIRKITPAGVVSTLAGLAGSQGSADGTGSAARFYHPYGVAVDGSGNVYVADTWNNTIRKITPAGDVSTLAGLAGTSGTADGTGSAARFTWPTGVAVDGTGNVYVAGGNSPTIRKIAPTGDVTTLAGTAGSTDSAGSADGTGSAARFNHPYGVAVDASGNVYVADQFNNTIRKITPAGVVSTLAGLACFHGSTDGTGSVARFYEPYDVAVDGSGNVYVADTDNQTIRKITPAGVVSTLAGTAGSYGSADGTGNAARFCFPYGVAVDGLDNVYVADSYNSSIRKITPAGVVSTLAGGGGAGSADGTGSAARFNEPWGVAADGSGNVYVADTHNHTIRKITPAGVVSTLAGLAGSPGSADGTGSTARFEGPWGVAVDGSGNVYVADRSNQTIRKITPGGDVSTMAGLAGSQGSADGTGSAARFDYPCGVAVDGSGNVYVADGYFTIRKITPTGDVTTLAGLAATSQGSTDGTGSAARFNYPCGVAVDGSGNVYVADTFNNTIRKGTPSIADVAIIDQASGAAGATRQLDTSPQTAVTWQWNEIRFPTGSSAALSSTSIRNPTFTPDVADLYVFRLLATDAAGNQSISTVQLMGTPGAAAKLAFGQQPGNTLPGASITPAVTVLVQDTYGNAVTSDNSSVELAILDNPGGGTLSGTKNVAAVNGEATFSDLSINKVGTGYTLAATDGTLTGATSSAFNVAAGVISVSVPANGTYMVGQNLDFTVNWSEAVTVNTGGGTPYIPVTLDVGGMVSAAYLSGSGSAALVFRYTVATGNLDTNGIVLGAAITANGGTLKDGAGNDAMLTLNGVGSTTGVLVDGVPPTVSSSVLAAASPTNATSVNFTVTFSENVSGVDTADFTLTTTGVAGAAVTGVAGGPQVYTVSVNTGTGDGTIRLDVVDDDSIVDGASNPLGGPGAGNGNFTAGETYTIEKTAPIVTINQAGGQADPANNVPINFTVVFNEPVTGFATGAVSLGGTAGATTALVTEIAPNDGTTYNVAVTGMGGNGTVTASIAGGVCVDTAGNGNAASTSTDNTVTFDTIIPIVTNVTSTAADGAYGAGQTVSVAITFSKVVTVTGGPPQLTLATGGPGTSVNCSGGSGTNTLTFSYTVQAGHSSLDLDYVSASALVLNGGTIRDAALNDADLTLPSPGAAGSLGANKNIVVDTTNPTISNIADQTINEDSSTGALAFTVGDTETPLGSLTLSATSSNTALVPTGDIVFGGSGANRTVTVTPLANQFGAATITLTVTDQVGLTASDSFLLVVNAVNDQPTLDPIGNVTISEDSAAQTVNVSGISAGPANENNQTITVTASSSDTALIPPPTVNYSSPNPTGTLTFAPVADAYGTATITVTAQDNGGTVNAGVDRITRAFTVTVNPLPPRPADISPIAGPDIGGQEVTITGTKLRNVSQVAFGGVAATITANTATSITVVTPQHAAGVVDVVVTGPGGQGTLAGSYTFIANYSATIYASPDPATLNMVVTLKAHSNYNTMVYEWWYFDAAGTSVVLRRRVASDANGWVRDTHSWSEAGTYRVSLTLWNPADPDREVAALNVVIVAPDPSTGGMPNISDSHVKIVKSVTGNEVIRFTIDWSDGGVLTFLIDILRLLREDEYDVETEVAGVHGVLATVRGPTVVHKFRESGVYVLTTTVRDAATGEYIGKIRQTVAISRAETGEPPLATAPPANTKVIGAQLKGKFLFASDKPDVVSLRAKVSLPVGMDLGQEQTIALGIGNIIDEVVLDTKGKAKGASVLGRIKSLKLKYPRLKGTTITAAGQTVDLNVTLSTADMDVKGFDTEGVSADAAALQSQPDIQVLLVFGGMSYESQVPVEFKLSPKRDTGKILNYKPATAQPAGGN